MIVLSYNQSLFVVETLEGVKAQTYKPTQLIIIDDCSTDDSVATIERWLQASGIDCTFHPFTEKNLGICKSLNDGLAQLPLANTSPWWHPTISWLPDKIARQVELMESQPDHVRSRTERIFSRWTNTDVPFRHVHRRPSQAARDSQGEILNVLLEGKFILRNDYAGSTELLRPSRVV